MMSGSRTKSLAPGTKASPVPPATSRIGYGIWVRSASSRNAPTPARTARITRSPCMCISARMRALLGVGGQGRHGQRGDALAAPDEAEALAGRGLHVDLARVDAQRLGELGADRAALGAELRALHHDRRVDVVDGEP